MAGIPPWCIGAASFPAAPPHLELHVDELCRNRGANDDALAELASEALGKSQREGKMQQER